MSRAFDLLIVDDDAAQVALVRNLLRELDLTHRCHHCSSGEQTLAFLRRKPPFESAPRPHLILLDLNMPGMNGGEVLRKVKSDPELSTIPVVMLSSSRALKDVDACYKAHANAYIKKPLNLDGNLNFLRHLDQFWNDCELPPD